MTDKEQFEKAIRLLKEFINHFEDIQCNYPVWTDLHRIEKEARQLFDEVDNEQERS